VIERPPLFLKGKKIYFYFKTARQPQKTPPPLLPPPPHFETTTTLFRIPISEQGVANAITTNSRKLISKKLTG